MAQTNIMVIVYVKETFSKEINHSILEKGFNHNIPTLVKKYGTSKRTAQLPTMDKYANGYEERANTKVPNKNIKNNLCK